MEHHTHQFKLSYFSFGLKYKVTFYYVSYKNNSFNLWPAKAYLGWEPPENGYFVTFRLSSAHSM